MNHFDLLNPQQKEAVLATQGPVLVLAGAGAGKTRVIAHRILELVRQGVAPGNILAITFTNKAAGEMRERVLTLLGESAEVNRPIHAYSDGAPVVSTFHSLGLRIVKENYRQAGLKKLPAVYDRADSMRTVKRALKEMGEESVEPRLVLSAISRAKGEGIGADTYFERAQTHTDRIIADAYRRYERVLAADQALDFDDLLMRAVSLLESHAEVRQAYLKRWTHVHVDEYQDTNAQQAKMLRLLVGPELHVCAVADPDQCVAKGTAVTMADGVAKSIESVRVGDLVLSNFGSGDYRPAKVISKIARKTGNLVAVTTATGKRIVSTPEHIHFAGYRLGITPQRYFTYLMYKRDFGFRLGVSQVYTKGQRLPVIGFQQRCNQEHGDMVWIVGVHSNPSEARIHECVLSLNYRVPTLPFFARKGGSQNGYVHDQEAIRRIFRSFDTETHAKKLLNDLGLSIEHPHHRSQSGANGRKNIVLTLCGDRRGKTPMHRMSIAASDPESRRALESIGLSVRSTRRNPSSWRFDTCRADYGKLLEVLGGIRAVLPNAAVIETARLGGEKTNPKDGNSLPSIPAGSILPGMAMFDGTGGYDVVEKVERVDSKNAEVFDLNIEHTHNYIANGLITHNCIYSWRGALVSNTLSFEKQFPKARRILLEENYRSTKTILAAANDLISKNRFRVEKNLFTNNTDGERLTVFQAMNEADEAAFVTRKAKELIEQGARPSHMAVLYRANFQSRALEEALLAADVPYQVLGLRFFERAEVKDALSFIRAALHGASADIARIANVPRRGIGKTTLLAMLSNREAELPAGMREKIAQFRSILDDIGRKARDAAPSAVVKYAIARSGMETELKADKYDGQERLENLRELTALAARYDHLPPEEGLATFLENAALASDQDELKDEQNAVRLMTVHASKGLEFPYVFITGLEEGLFPYERAGEKKDDPEEERRLMYVALTRAQKKLFLSFASIRTVFGSQSFSEPSSFLSELPEELLERENPERLGKTIYLE